jgi:hypothetical protein
VRAASCSDAHEFEPGVSLDIPIATGRARSKQSRKVRLPRFRVVPRRLGDRARAVQNGREREKLMPRVLVVGQPGETGPLSCDAFAEQLAQRLGIPPLTQREQARASDHWIAAEPAGQFSEPLFRHVETVVWLHFSPLPYLRDWFERQRSRLGALIDPQTRRAAGARWDDVVTAFRYLMRAPDLYELFRHPALAHVKVIELRNPRQAEFWLMAQRRRVG